MIDRELLELAAKASGSLEYVAELDAWNAAEKGRDRKSWLWKIFQPERRKPR